VTCPCEYRLVFCIDEGGPVSRLGIGRFLVLEVGANRVLIRKGREAVVMIDDFGSLFLEIKCNLLLFKYKDYHT
jgi:hypothetical protein